MSAKTGQEFVCARRGCPETTWRTPSEIEASVTKKFHCTMECAAANPDRWVRADDNRPRCEWCGEPFPRCPNKDVRNRFCPAKLRDCKAQAKAAGWRMRKTRADKGKLGEGSIRQICDYPPCTEPVKVIKFAQERSELHFHSDECRNAMSSELSSGATGFLGGANRKGKDGLPPVWRPVETPDGIKVGIWNKGGYVTVRYPEHPSASKSGYVLEHRMVMERILGRQLEKKTQVHHLNGVRDDNRPENLALLISTRHPQGASVGDLLKYWREMIERYEGDEQKMVEAGMTTSLVDAYEQFGHGDDGGRAA